MPRPKTSAQPMDETAQKNQAKTNRVHGRLRRMGWAAVGPRLAGGKAVGRSPTGEEERQEHQEGGVIASPLVLGVCATHAAAQLSLQKTTRSACAVLTLVVDEAAIPAHRPGGSPCTRLVLVRIAWAAGAKRAITYTRCGATQRLNI
jgi:hypothetical protein